ncbi:MULTISPECIES: acyl-CoA thioesterase domain-containing protein [Nocardioides]|uniref:Acyl-CoA thioesterase domain-containing protein n=1 Tax=Nocardioides vastitatis TaxID=2568655 RepID=A0ABW0ZHM2_9ACTN|nr:acyl-CoA thioesterase domain-containing protein [Nocardioides sp.]
MNENTFQLGWFRRDGDTYTPLPLAQSLWRADQMHGVAVSGLLARTLEQRVAVTGRTDLVPARYHVDLFRPARMTATTSSATIVREGPRLLLLDAVVEQDGEVVARAGATFLTSSQNPPGEVWSAEDRPSPPPADVAPSTGEHHVPIFASGKPWSDDFTEHQNAGRHQTWQTAMPIVVDEECTPFQAVASIADATSMVTNWGSGGVEFINTDISLAIARLPESASLGLRTTDHVASAGVAVGTAEVFDRLGPIGTATVTSLANTRRTVDLSASEWDGSKGTPGV